MIIDTTTTTKTNSNIKTKTKTKTKTTTTTKHIPRAPQIAGMSLPWKIVNFWILLLPKALHLIRSAHILIISFLVESIFATKKILSSVKHFNKYEQGGFLELCTN